MQMLSVSWIDSNIRLMSELDQSPIRGVDKPPGTATATKSPIQSALRPSSCPPTTTRPTTRCWLPPGPQVRQVNSLALPILNSLQSFFADAYYD
jgi:hypothetical protein